MVFLFSFFFLIAYGLLAQQNHFIYLQTENKQPFYIKLNKKILSSSASGYLIIPKLQDGNYTLTIGFPKNEWPEQNVTCTLDKKDEGFLLKNFVDKGWGLFNLQTMELVMSDAKIFENKDIADDTKKDVFSNTLSNVVNDPSIVKKSEIKPVISEVVKPVVESVKKEESLNPTTGIAKLLSTHTSEGTEMVYIDIVNDKPDTISVFIPAEKVSEIILPVSKVEVPVVERKIDTIKNPEIKNSDIDLQNSNVKVDTFSKQLIIPEIINEKKTSEPKLENKKAETKSGDTKFIDIELPNPNAKADTTSKQLVTEVISQKKPETIVIPEKQKENIVKPVMINSDCKNFAIEDDFLKLRKKMAAESNDDDMLGLAKKTFRSKCFTTEQVKNLSVLFLKDEGKYSFFDLAYPFVSDSYNFSSLETQLQDNYLINRFRAMIRH